MAAASRSPSPTKMLGGSRLSPTEHQKTAPSPPPVPKLLTVELILRTWQALGMKRALKENEYIRVDEKIFVPVDPDAPPPPPPPPPCGPPCRAAACGSLTTLEEQDGLRPKVKVDEVLGRVDHVRAVVGADDAVPCGAAAQEGA